MRKAVFTMLIAVVSSSASAEWLESCQSERFTCYIDSDTILKAGKRVKVWELFDYKTTQDITPAPYISMKVQDEFDCEESHRRALYTSFHSGNMGEGNTVLTDSDPGKWKPVPPDSAVELLWKIACGKG